MTRITCLQIEQYAIILIFLVSIVIPPVIWISHKDAVYSKTEKRYLNSFSDIPYDHSITEFSHAFDKYYQDHFGLRGWLIHRYQREMTKRFKTTGVKSVIEGQDNWLFFARENVLEDLKGMIHFSPTEERHFWQNLEKRRKWYADKKIAYMVLVAPNKQSIYPNFLPKSLQLQAKQSRLDRLLAQRPAGTKTPLIDPRSLLLEGKKKWRLYDKTDTHWNYRGAFIAYRAIRKQTSKLFPEVDINTDFQFAKTPNYWPGGDLALMIGRSKTTTETRPVLVKNHFTAHKRSLDKPLADFLSLPELQPLLFVNPQRKLKALILRDSFFNQLQPFVSESFAQTLYIWKYYNEKTQEFCSMETMETLLKLYTPDLVIEETVERHFDLLLAPYSKK
jgi:hypothetical protein